MIAEEGEQLRVHVPLGPHFVEQVGPVEGGAHLERVVQRELA
jgi:hypothetical protein